MHPALQRLERLGIAAGQYLDTAIRAIDCVARQTKPFSLLTRGFPEPNSLDTPFDSKSST